LVLGFVVCRPEKKLEIQLEIDETLPVLFAGFHPDRRAIYVGRHEMIFVYLAVAQVPDQILAHTRWLLSLGILLGIPVQLVSCRPWVLKSGRVVRVCYFDLRQCMTILLCLF